MKFYIEKTISKKGSEYVALKVDLGYKTLVVTFDQKIIMELGNFTPEEFFLMPLDNKHYL